ncbi:MAG: hypothetical protein V2I97_11125 [Desulfococcaceae bacterium]|jgi:hypothetical protein|nr:hypothetical protein [Desulfococcaceae bacterium]
MLKQSQQLETSRGISKYEDSFQEITVSLSPLGKRRKAAVFRSSGCGKKRTGKIFQKNKRFPAFGGPREISSVLLFLH